MTYFTHTLKVFKRHVRPPMFPPQLWNVNSRTLSDEPRTNNHLEGWHRRFKSIVDKFHPNIYEFIDTLQGEHARTEMVIQQLIGDGALQEARPKIKKMNEKLQRVVQDFGKRSSEEFLRGIAYNIRY
ncbi:uncharacterized protein LOC123541908 [Mercenaria mercenaria]|uniref:uncharacterized protein LOC123541908 n=1 Tax=Mercenaria mercenaria TaxID=6596 RepID=UPI00234EA8D0|nr:uncharacterized protein LOC123541908 [Mercenaria mercenaria]